MLKYFAVLVLLVVVYTEVESKSCKCGAVCGRGWSFNQVTGKCYRLFNTRRTWTQAFYACKTTGGHLVRINNAKEYSVVSKMARYFWVDGKRDCSKKRFSFGLSVNTNARPYIKWARGEPNNKGGNEDCLQISNRFNNDNKCSSKMIYVCEKAPKYPRI